MSQNIRNFCIIAHIDHGKSTLADRMLEITGTIKKLGHAQVLDRMDIEQERGITIKLTPARMQRKGCELNLIDTPGHVDFQYEVSRSLAAVEGAILLVDASQGIQAQTLSVLYMAMEYDLQIIPVLNKIDLPAANPKRVALELEHLLGVSEDEMIMVSGKTGLNVDRVLDAIVERVQDPATFMQKNLKKYWSSLDCGIKYQENVSRALIFDSVYDPYKGVVTYVKVVNGSFEVGKKVDLIYSGTSIQPIEVGYFTPDYKVDKKLSAGQIGYIVTGQKSVRDAKIGDTLLRRENRDIDNKENKEPKINFSVPGFKKVKPFVYAGVYPLTNDDFEKLRDSFEKLSLNDSAIECEYENSKALGYGLRCGFLGMLHMDIIKERLVREYNVETIFTSPNVVYLVKMKSASTEKMKTGANVVELVKSGLFKEILPKEKSSLIDTVTNDQELSEKLHNDLKMWLLVRSGADVPDPGFIDEIREPVADMEVVGPQEFSGNIMELCQEHRGTLSSMDYLDETRVVWKYKIPVGEMIVDFYDKLKSATKGYATMNYEFRGYEMAELVRLDIFINGDRVEAFSSVVHRDKSYHWGKNVVEKLKELIPKHLFAIPLQAGIGAKMIARETIPAIKKDVLAKCYGGDVSRKRKLLEKQKEGKKKMKEMGRVSVPSDIFIKMVSK